MSNEPAFKELDPTPLVQLLIEKSEAGHLKWEATADEKTFIASVGGNTTLKVTLESEEIPSFGEAEELPVLFWMDVKGRTLQKVYPSQVRGGLWKLYGLAQRIGNKLDEKMAALMEVVQNL